MEKLGRLLGRSDELHPAKILLRHLAGSELTGLDVYRRYIESTLNLNLSHVSLGGMSDNTLGKFYGSELPLEPPRFFDFNVNFCQDVSKLEVMLGIRIVVLYVRPQKPNVLMLHDRSVYSLLGGHQRVKPTVFVCLTKEKKVTSLFECDSRMGYDPLDYLTGRGYVAAVGDISAVGGCHLELFSALVSKELAEHVHDASCYDLSSLLSDWKITAEAFAPLSVVVVAHLRSSVACSGRTVKDSFGMITTPPSPPPDSKVLCLMSDGRFFLVRGDKVPCLLTPEVRSRYPRNQELPPPMTGIRPGACSGDGKPRDKMRVLRPPCDCDACGSAGEYADNMAEGGAPVLYKHKTTLFDLLRSVGLLTGETEKLINECASLSVGSFDVETFTVSVSDEAGNEDCLYPQPPVSDRSLPRVVKARMQPVLIGYTDTLMLDERADVSIFGGWTEEDETKSKLDMVGEFADFVKLRQDAASERKLLMLSDLLLWTERYQEVYTSFYRWGVRA